MKSLLTILTFVSAQTSLQQAERVALAFETLTEPLWYYATGLTVPILAGVEACSLKKNQTAIVGATMVDTQYSFAERTPIIERMQNTTKKLDHISDNFLYYYRKLFEMQNQPHECYQMLENATEFTLASAGLLLDVARNASRAAELTTLCADSKCN